MPSLSFSVDKGPKITFIYMNLFTLIDLASVYFRLSYICIC